MAIEWNETMKTGVREIDDAHKTLIMWINKLNIAMKTGTGRQEVINILNFLGTYATKHFSHEEGCMMQYNCPTAQANKKAHAEFLIYFATMKKKIEASEGATISNVLEISNALSDWLKNHIMKIDTGLLQCTIEKK